jgi:hypothetical protein
MEPKDDEIGGRGLSMDKIMKNYRRLDSRKAMHGEEDVPLFEGDKGL